MQPTLKLFSAADGSLRPYTMLGLYAQGYGQRSENTEIPAESEFTRREFGARVGIGMEWMPVARVGVGGHVGVGGGYMESRVRRQLRRRSGRGRVDGRHLQLRRRGAPLLLMPTHTTHSVNPMRLRLLAAAAAALLASPALAQDAPAVADTTPAPNGLRKGAWSLSFSAPGYSGSGERAEFGVWEMVGARTNLGLTLEVSVSGRDREGEEQGADQTEASTSVQLGANLRRYVSTARSVAPFVQGRVFGRGYYTRRDGLGYEESIRGVSGGRRGPSAWSGSPCGSSAWRGTRVCGWASGGWSRTRSIPTKTPIARLHYRDVIFQTFTSALSVQIYF